jgi:FkbM family methyltransferase
MHYDAAVMTQEPSSTFSTFLTRTYQKTLRFLVGKGLGGQPWVRTLYRWFTSIISWIPMPMAHPHGVNIHQNLCMVLHGPDYNQPFEEVTTELIQKEVLPGQTVFDIGAHVGYYTCLLAKQVGPTGRVFAFEPGKHNLRMLRKNVRANNLTNVTIVPAAVSDTEGSAQFFEHGAQSSIGHKQLSTLTSTGDVRTITLDTFLPDVAQVDFIKMDIEGSEGKAIRGMKRFLAGNVKLVMEFFPGLLTKAGEDPRAI